MNFLLDPTQYLLNIVNNVVMGIGFYVVPGDLKRWIRAIDRIDSRARFLSNETPRLQAIGFHQMVVKNIMTQKGMGGYAAYNPTYADWKAQHGWGDYSKFWKLHGDLIKAMAHFPIGSQAGVYTWFSGIPSQSAGYATAKTTDSGGKSYGKGRKREIAWYGRIMEEGYSGYGQFHPKRPLFQPTLVEFASSEWEAIGEQSLNKLSNYWR